MTKYLRVANVFDGYIDTTDVLEMPFTPEERSRYLLREGDLLLNEGQSLALVGRPALYLGSPADCCFQNTLIRFQPGSNTCPHFALQRFRLCLYDGTFKTIATQTTSIAHLGVSRFAGLKLSWPPLVEQRRIVEILAAWDEAVGTSERLLANSFKQKRALMRELLNPCSKRNGWHACRLGDLFTERVEAARDDLPLLSITRDEGVILRSDVGRKDTSNDDKSKYLRICEGDIGYNTMRMWQGVSALSSLEGIVSPAYTVLVPNEKVDARFAAYLFKFDSMVFQFYRHSQGMVSDTWSLKFKHFAQIKVTIPSRKEQKRIVEVLAASDRTIEALEGELGRLQREKQALMQQLLTGKRRVRLPEVVEAASA